MNTREWWAEITYQPTDADIDDETLAAIVAALPDFGILTRSPAAVTVECTVEAATLAEATTAALYAADEAVKAGLADTATGIRVLTAEQRDAEIAHPAPLDLVGITEIADLLGVKRQRADELTHSADFPDPIGTARGGRYWTLDSVEKFAQRWQRKPGRPAKR